MTWQETLSALEAAGSEQTRKTWTRHGITRPMFGVKFSDLEIIRKKIKIDDPLAHELWKSGNHDACVLATMIADPGKATVTSLTKWAETPDQSTVMFGVARLAGQSAVGKACFEKWAQSKNDQVSSAAWKVLSEMATAEPGELDSFFEKQLKRIEAEIHKAPNDTKNAMNRALIAIGARNGRLEPLALGVAKRIGKVEVDHGDTCCKTPDATAYIKKMAARRRARR